MSEQPQPEQKVAIERFSKESTIWDEDLVMRVIRDNEFRLFATRLPFRLSTARTDVLDFGCGTGAVALHLQARVHEVVAVDSSFGMMDVLKLKLSHGQHKIENVVPICMHVTREDDIPNSVDRFKLAVSSLTLHRADSDSQLCLFYDLLKPGGWLCGFVVEQCPHAAHFFPGDGSDIVQAGFEPEALALQLTSLGFERVSVSREFSVVKADRTFPMLMLLARKPGPEDEDDLPYTPPVPGAAQNEVQAATGWQALARSLRSWVTWLGGSRNGHLTLLFAIAVAVVAAVVARRQLQLRRL